VRLFWGCFLELFLLHSTGQIFTIMQVKQRLFFVLNFFAVQKKMMVELVRYFIA
jgi:hypothetical protein